MFHQSLTFVETRKTTQSAVMLHCREASQILQFRLTCLHGQKSESAQKNNNNVVLVDLRRQLCELHGQHDLADGCLGFPRGQHHGVDEQTEQDAQPIPQPPAGSRETGPTAVR